MFRTGRSWLNRVFPWATQNAIRPNRGDRDRSRTRTRFRQRLQRQIEELESRIVLATTYVQTGGTLTITAGSAAESFIINTDAADLNLQIFENTAETGAPTRTFPLTGGTAVTGIVLTC